MADRLRKSHRFSTVPEHLIRDQNIGDRALRLWCLLDRYAGANGEAFPLRATLAEDLGCSLASVDRALGELTMHGWLSKERREAGGSNDYTLLIAPVPPLAAKRAKRQGTPSVTSDATPSVTGDATPVVTGDETSPHPRREGVVTGDAHKEASGKEASTKDSGGQPPVSDLNAHREDVTRTCEHLASLLRARDIKAAPESKRWRDAARLLMDLDKRTEAQVHNMIDWCQRDEFWSTTIHSMPNLREHYDRMRDKAMRQRGSIDTRHNLPTDNPSSAARAAAMNGGTT